MSVYILLVIMAWVITMPIWLSITITTVCSFMMGIKIISLIIDIIKAKLEIDE